MPTIKRQRNPNQRIWDLTQGDSPIVAVALHSGHEVRTEVARHLALASHERLREEDPCTDVWTGIAENRVIGTHSRFEADLNRPRDRAVYRTPDDAWGLEVWKAAPPESLVQRSLAAYDAFYSEMQEFLNALIDRFQRVVIFDIHSYNHRRSGPETPAADSGLNPEINLGTGTMYRRRWVTVVDRFRAELGGFDYFGRHLDVRENVKFFGGHLAKWAHETFPTSVCVLSVEVKKIYMDEWTGKVDPKAVEEIRKALESTIAGVLEELSKL